MGKKRLFILVGAVIAILSLAFLAAACGEDEEGDGAETPPAGETPPETPAGETTVDISLVEFDLILSTDTVPAGTVTFNLSNDGAAVHNLRVVKTDLAPDALPYNEDDFMVDESQVDVSASSEDIDVGETGVVTADLEAGSYVLICNIPTHYEADMYTTFTVQ